MRKTVLVTLLFSVISIPTQSSAWSPIRRLTWNPGISEWPAITARGPADKIHVFWSDNSFGNFEICHRSSADKGTTWSSMRRLTWTPGYSRYPNAKADFLGNIYLAWIDETPGHKEIYFKKSNDDGANWSGIKRITWSTGSVYPFILIDNFNAVYLFWHGESDIFFRKSTDQGGTWIPTKRLTWSAGYSRSVCAAVDSSNGIHIVWMELISPNFQVYHRKSSDGGSSWSQAKRLTWTADSSMYPVIGIDSLDNIYVIYTGSAPEEIYMKKSSNSGANWGAPIRLTWNSGRSLRQRLTINSYDILHVIWDDESPGNIEIYHKWLSNGGLVLGNTVRLTWNSGNSVSPDIIADKKDNLHLVWSDVTPGNYEIFYKNLIGGGILKESL